MTGTWIDWLQWPAMAATVLASWQVSSSREGRRNAGFWVFLVSNALWLAWGWHTHAYALMLLQVCLAAMNIRGARKTRAALEAEKKKAPERAPGAA